MVVFRDRGRGVMDADGRDIHILTCDLCRALKITLNGDKMWNIEDGDRGGKRAPERVHGG